MSRAALAAALLACAACRPKAPLAVRERQQQIEGLVLSQSRLGKPAWTLATRVAVLREDADSAALTEPVMEFYNGGRRPVSRVTARSGRIDTETHDVRLSESVVLDSFDDHSRLTTDELDYSAKRGRFETRSEVEIRRPDGVLRGKGLEATPDLSEIHIHNQRSELQRRPG